MIINTIILLSPLTILSRNILLREKIFSKKKRKEKRNSRVLFPYFSQKIIVIYRFKSMKFRSQIGFLIKRLSLRTFFSSLSAKNTPCFHPNDRTIFSSKILKIDSQECSWIIPDGCKSGQMIPSQRLRSCLRCWNVSKDELKERERENYLGERYTCFIDLSLVEMKREGMERVINVEEIYLDLCPSEDLLICWFLIPRGRCSWRMWFLKKIFLNIRFYQQQF